MLLMVKMKVEKDATGSSRSFLEIRGGHHPSTPLLLSCKGPTCELCQVACASSSTSFHSVWFVN